MKKTNKLISILLVLAMLLSMAPLSLTAFAATPTPYDGVPVTPQKISSSNYAKLGLTDANWSQFNGYYAIRNAKELYGFASIVCHTSNSQGVNAVLLQDIVVNANGGTTYDWSPIADQSNSYAYEGIFDGNGHYISGLYSTVAITAVGGNNAKFSGFICNLYGTVKNLVIKDSTFAPGTDISTYGGLGAITGYPYGCTIQNCRVENVTLKSINDGGQLGGIAGYGNGGSSTIKNCVSINVTFSGGKYTDPIAPKAPYSSCYTSATASHNCSNLSVEHKEVKATCEYPGLSNYKYCLVCNSVTSGTKTETPVTHTWKDATCTEPQTCSSCGETQGDALGHTNLRFKIDVSNHRKAEYCCDVCGVVGTVTLSVQDAYYDGNPHGATITYTGDVPELTVSYRNGDTGVTSTEVPVEAGRYDASVKAGAFNLSGMFLIYKRAIDNITAPTPNTLTYDGEAHALISAGETSIGTMVYSLDGEEYSEEIPQGTNAGDYIVYYKVIGDKNHKNTEPATLTITINAKDISDGFIILGDALTYNGTEQTQTVEKVLPTGTAPEATYSVSGNKATNVGVYLLTVTGTGNFTGEAKIAYEIAVDKSGIEGLTIDYVKSTDKENVEYVYSQLENAVKDLADEDKISEWNTLQSYCAAMRQRIYIIENLIDTFENKSGEYDINTVTSDDAAYLESFQNSVGKFYNDYYDNLTDEQIKKVTDIYWLIEDLETRISDVAEEITRLTNAVNGYDETTVKSSDKADVEQLIADIKYLTDGQNITTDERAKLENLDETADALLAKIAETTVEYNRVIAAANGYDEATVTSADKDALVQLNDDIYALALTDNVTAEELENLENAHNKVLGLIDKLTAISDEIKRIIEAVDKYVFESVKSSDKADIEQLIADIKALLDTQNITADERALLEGADETCTKLIEKVDKTVAEISRINDATNTYDEATVKYSDYKDILQLIDDIEALTDGQNITDDERASLEELNTKANLLAAKIRSTADEISRITRAVNTYNIDTVKSSDKADIENLIARIKKLTDGDNITSDERINLNELDSTLDALLAKIDDTTAEIERIDEDVNGYDKETVTSDDVPELGKLIEDIKALTDGDNLTEDEKAALEANDEAIDDLVEKLAEVAEEIKRVDEETKSFDIDSVKSTDTEALDQLKADIQSLIDSDNTTDNEKTALEEMIKDIESLEDKITETEEKLEKIKDIENGYNPENVSSDDKSAIEEAIAEIEAVNPDNLTDEQKAEYEEIKAGFEALLEEIAAAEKDVADIGVELEMFDEERVTIFNEEEIEALKAKIDELLADENMGETEKTKLNEYKALAEKLIEIINDPCEYFSMRLFCFIWDALHWLSSHVVFIFNWIAAML